VINGGGGDDTLSGLEGSDRLIGGSGKDRLDGGDGNDILDGGSGDDQLWGGAGNDQLSGGVGKDRITGGAGADTLTGGDGVDVFVFQSLSDSTAAGPDLILDFGSDQIDLRGIDADANVAGDQAFRFVSQFSGAARRAVLSFDDDADVTTLSLDVNGDGAADFTLLISGDATTASSSAWLL
jgi:Ca2+-binding RTX toxin-like protein